MPTIGDYEIDGPTAWRIVVFAVIAVAFVVAYRSTGSLLESLVLAFLGALAVAVAVMTVSSLLRAVQRAL